MDRIQRCPQCWSVDHPCDNVWDWSWSSVCRSWSSVDEKPSLGIVGYPWQPPIFGEDEPILIFFQRGWFNHQLDIIGKWRVCFCFFFKLINPWFRLLDNNHNGSFLACFGFHIRWGFWLFIKRCNVKSRKPDGIALIEPSQVLTPQTSRPPQQSSDRLLSPRLDGGFGVWAHLLPLKLHLWYNADHAGWSGSKEILY